MPSLFLLPAGKGRRVVFWSLACFAISQLALTAYLECRRPEVRDPLYGHRLLSLRSRLAESPGAPLVLALGSSRVKYSLWPAAMQLHSPEGTPAPVVYNFGINGLGTIREWMYFRRLLADGVRPDWLLLEVWPPLWAESGFFEEARMVQGEDDQHWRDVPVLARYFHGKSELLSLGVQKCLVPITAYRSNLIDAVMETVKHREPSDEEKRHLADWIPVDNTGWFRVPWVRTTPEQMRIAIEHGADEMKPLVDPLCIDPRSDRALRELLDECRGRGIKVALVLMPEHSRTRGWYSPQARELTQRYLGGLRDEYAIPVLDTRTWVRDEDFIDYCHVGTPGVRPFSQRVGREVIQPLLEGRMPDAEVLLKDDERSTASR